MTAGRPPESAPEGYYTVKEAARLLGVHEDTIRNRLRDGRLEGIKPGDEGEYTTEAGEPRYYVKKSAVGRSIGRAAEVERWGYQADIPLELEDIVRRYIELNQAANREIVKGILDAINHQREQVSKAINEQREQVSRAIERQREELLNELKSEADREKEHQERVRYHEQVIRRLILLALIVLSLFAALVFAVLVVEVLVLR